MMRAAPLETPRQLFHSVLFIEQIVRIIRPHGVETVSENVRPPLCARIAILAPARQWPTRMQATAAEPPAPLKCGDGVSDHARDL
jgi:hypothetical protein